MSDVRLYDSIILIRSVYASGLGAFHYIFLYILYVKKTSMREWHNRFYCFRGQACRRTSIWKTYRSRKGQCGVEKGVAETLWRSQEDGKVKGSFRWPNFVKTLLDSPARHVVMSLISDICCGRRLISLLALPVSDDFVKIQVRWDVMLWRASSLATCVTHQTTNVQEHSCEREL